MTLTTMWPEFGFGKGRETSLWRRRASTTRMPSVPFDTTLASLRLKHVDPKHQTGGDRAPNDTNHQEGGVQNENL
jgi:hypothetical protein